MAPESGCIIVRIASGSPTTGKNKVQLTQTCRLTKSRKIKKHFGKNTMIRRTFLMASAALLIEPALPALAATWPAPPTPLPNLVIHHIQRGRQTITGSANQDLLLCAPAGTLTSKTQVFIDGFRGIYLIGASFNRLPRTNLVTPNGHTVPGTGVLIQARNHKNAHRPFTYLADIRVNTSRVCYGDLFEFGCPTHPADVWMDRIHVHPGCIGWGGYYGGTTGNKVSHSDFRKAEVGYWGDLNTRDCDISWGFQMMFDLPSYATNFHEPPGAVSRFLRTNMRPLLSHPNFPQAGPHKCTCVFMAEKGRTHKRFSFTHSALVAANQAQYVKPQSAIRQGRDGLHFTTSWAQGELQKHAVVTAAPRSHRIHTRAQLMAYLR